MFAHLALESGRMSPGKNGGQEGGEENRGINNNLAL
jgi:hypothetical protein